MFTYEKSTKEIKFHLYELTYLREFSQKLLTRFQLPYPVIVGNHKCTILSEEYNPGTAESSYTIGRVGIHGYSEKYELENTKIDAALETFRGIVNEGDN